MWKTCLCHSAKDQFCLINSLKTIHQPKHDIFFNLEWATLFCKGRRERGVNVRAVVFSSSPDATSPPLALNVSLFRSAPS